MRSIPFLPLVLVLWSVFSYPQAQKHYTVRTIAFYNVENLFDTINDPDTFDDDRTPKGKDHWTSEYYTDKLHKIARVISEIGAAVTGTSPDIVGLCEVENYEVLYDLVHNTKLSDENYGIIHFDSPDERGIDTALLYKKEVFLPMSFKNYPLYLYHKDGRRDYTRDQLLVSGLLDGEELHFIINHWPSRSGGEARSRPGREAAAALNKKIISLIRATNPKAKVISMGDLNDDPSSSSLKKVLKTGGKRHKVKAGALYNPMEALAKRGLGSIAHHDNWHLFDQLFFTETLLKENKAGYRYWKAGIYNKPYLMVSSGRYKGYPFRSYTRGTYTGGYSDHFPVYLYLIKEAGN